LKAAVQPVRIDQEEATRISTNICGNYQRVGAYVKERSGAKVDLENADLTCWIEVYRPAFPSSYVERCPGPAGCPPEPAAKSLFCFPVGSILPLRHGNDQARAARRYL